MLDIKITKTFVKLTKDYICESSFYTEEIRFIPAGTEGVVIDCHTIGLIPNLSEEKHSEITHREFQANKNNSYLVLIEGKLLPIHVSNLEIIRYDPPANIFEDDADRDQYFDDLFSTIRNKYSEGNKDGSP
ncbi:MAG: hypothetical protein ACH350_09815 [Parachlamydiaceae bacterium]